jgi:hypothetical protein
MGGAQKTSVSNSLVGTPWRMSPHLGLVANEKRGDWLILFATMRAHPEVLGRAGCHCPFPIARRLELMAISAEQLYDTLHHPYESTLYSVEAGSTSRMECKHEH